jgi:hypothetical protein
MIVENVKLVASVSFIGFILLTKSLSYNVIVLIGIPYYFRVF